MEKKKLEALKCAVVDDFTSSAIWGPDWYNVFTVVRRQSRLGWDVVPDVISWGLLQEMFMKQSRGAEWLKDADHYYFASVEKAYLFTLWLLENYKG